MHSVPVWDFPTRVFHWALAIAVIVCFVTGEGEGVQFVVHTLSGYAVAVLLMFRLVWGFIGSAHSRFGDFVYGPGAVMGYAGTLLRHRPPKFVGHNPLGGWMVVVMLVVLAATVVSGLFSGDDDGGRGILLPLIAPAGGEGLGDLHEVLGNLIIGLAAVHVVAVFVDWFLTGDNLVKAMITGRKTLDDDIAADERPLVAAWRGAVVALVVAAGGAVLLQQTDLIGAMSDVEHAGSEHENEDHDDDERDRRSPVERPSHKPETAAFRLCLTTGKA